MSGVFHRRDFALAALASSFAGVSVTIAQPLQTVTVKMQLDNQELQALGAERAHVQVSTDKSPAAGKMRSASPPGRAIPVIFIIVGVLSIPVLWRTLRSMFIQTYYGGVIIDTRTSPISILHDGGIPSGTIVVIDKTGAAQRFDEQDFSASQLGSLLKQVK